MSEDLLNIENLFESSFNSYKVEPSKGFWKQLHHKLWMKNFLRFNYTSLNVYYVSVLVVGSVIGISAIVNSQDTIRTDNTFNNKEIVIPITDSLTKENHHLDTFPDQKILKKQKKTKIPKMEITATKPAKKPKPIDTNTNQLTQPPDTIKKSVIIVDTIRVQIYDTIKVEKPATDSLDTGEQINKDTIINRLGTGKNTLSNSFESKKKIVVI